MGELTSEGLIIRRLPDVLDDIETSERANIDPSIDTSDDQELGQLNTIFGSSIADQEALAVKEEMRRKYATRYTEVQQSQLPEEDPDHIDIEPS